MTFKRPEILSHDINPTFESGDKILVEKPDGTVYNIDHDDIVAAAGGGSGFSLNVITPAAITGTVENYNPAGFGPGVMIRQDATGAGTTQEIGGFESSDFSDGDVFWVCNISTTDNIKVLDESPGSDADNQVKLLGDVQISQQMTVGFWWDATDSKFRALTERTN